MRTLLWPRTRPGTRSGPLCVPTSQLAPDASVQGTIGPGWVAVGGHLCGCDMYSSRFEFAFAGGELQRVGIRFDVRGPQKDYVADATLARAGDAP